MRRILFVPFVVLTVFLVVGTGTAANAASPHFKKGGTPTCTISGGGSTSTSTTCTATLAGLSGADLAISTTVGGFAVYSCTNNGGNNPQGQNRVLVGPSTTPTNINGDAVKNGNLTFTTNPAVLSAAPTTSGTVAGCPNNNYTGTNPQLTLTDITLVIAQGGVTIFTCKASDPNGLSGTVALAC